MARMNFETRIRKEDVNVALIQQAAEELEIGVPIYGYDVIGGRLVLYLAYGGEALWPPDANSEREHRWLEHAGFLQEPEAGKKPGPAGYVDDRKGNARPYWWEGPKKKARPIPEGDLNQVRRERLLRIAVENGFRTDMAYVTKRALVLVLEQRRRELRDGD